MREPVEDEFGQRRIAQELFDGVGTGRGDYVVSATVHSQIF
jgi:hypothetical protein